MESLPLKRSSRWDTDSCRFHGIIGFNGHFPTGGAGLPGCQDVAVLSLQFSCISGDTGLSGCQGVPELLLRFRCSTYLRSFLACTWCRASGLSGVPVRPDFLPPREAWFGDSVDNIMLNSFVPESFYPWIP